MTAVPPEREGEGLLDDTGQFAAAVGRLADPLNDPLPGRRPPAPGSEAGSGSPWFRPRGTPGPAPATPAAGPWTGPVTVPASAVDPGPAAAAGPFPGPGPVAGPGSAPAPEPVTLPVPGPEPAPAEEPAPDPVRPPQDPGGGRAARRRAAQEKGRRGRRPAPHGRRARRAATASPAAAAPAAPAAGPPAPSGPAGTRPGSRLEARRAARAAKDSPLVVLSRVLGELFITFGVLMLLFVVYQLWWTNVLAHKAANGTARALEEKWKDSGGGEDERAPGAFEPGEGFAILYIPKLDVKTPVAEGIDKHKVLDKGLVGHYAGPQPALKTAMPWDKRGNFAVAGHRNTHGEPFRYINKLKPGDPIVVETQNTYYVYEMASLLPQTSPSNIGVIGPVPPESGFTEPGRYITLTTCTPEFTSRYRMIVWGKLVEERPRDEGKPDALLD
ncbi:hypothetical protein GCM10027168_04360 [Streptomyces capparidis]